MFGGGRISLGLLGNVGIGFFRIVEGIFVTIDVNFANLGTEVEVVERLIFSLGQKLVLPYPQSVTFAIVSRCFENKNNNCCERKMPFVYIKNG